MHQQNAKRIARVNANGEHLSKPSWIHAIEFIYNYRPNTSRNSFGETVLADFGHYNYIDMLP